jgi:hypothetical protein
VTAPSEPAPATTKWTADAHTHAAIARMRAVVAASPLQKGVEGAAAAVFHELGNGLEAEVDALVAGCRMKGADHDALHQWLAELLPNVEQLLEGDDLRALVRAHQGVVATLGRFDVLFGAGDAPPRRP